MLQPGILRIEAIDKGIDQSRQCLMLDLDRARLVLKRGREVRRVEWVDPGVKIGSLGRLLLSIRPIYWKVTKL